MVKDVFGGFMEQFDLKQTWLSLSKSMRHKIASEAGTTAHYMVTHVIRKTREPSINFIKRLSKSMNSNGVGVDKKELTMWFL